MSHSIPVYFTCVVYFSMVVLFSRFGYNEINIHSLHTYISFVITLKIRPTAMLFVEVDAINDP